MTHDLFSMPAQFAVLHLDRGTISDHGISYLKQMVMREFERVMDEYYCDPWGDLDFSEETEEEAEIRAHEEMYELARQQDPRVGYRQPAED